MKRKIISIIATHNAYAISWLIGYGALWILSGGDDGSGGWWQHILLVTISVMAVPWIWVAPPLLSPFRHKEKTKKSLTGYRRVKQPNPTTPHLGNTYKEKAPPASHMQIKLSSAIIRAYMMSPYYLTYKIIYISGSNNEPSNVVFRRHRHDGKGCQYYYDKALAHLTSCHIERMKGFMSDQHTLMMIKQASDACRTLLMILDPENLEDEFPQIYREIDLQASEMAEFIIPHINGLVSRISPSSRPGHYMLSEAEILHWFECINKAMQISNENA